MNRTRVPIRVVLTLLFLPLSFGATVRAADMGPALRNGPPGDGFNLMPTQTSNKSGKRVATVGFAGGAEMESEGSLYAGEKENRATLSLSLPKANLLLSLSAPWSDKGNTQLASLDGLAGSTRFDGTFRYAFENAENIVLGVTAQAGYQTFEFFDSSGAQQSTRKTLWSFGPRLAVGLSRGVVFLGYKRESAYADDDSSDGSFCTSVTATALHCKDGFLAPPKKSNTNQGSLEFRWISNNNRFGIAPKVIRDFQKSVTGAELPLYLVRDEPTGGMLGPLNGGVKLGWRSDVGGVTAGLFIGAALSLK